MRRLKKEWPSWGTRRIAGMLARVGLAVSRTSVQSFLRRSPMKPADEDAIDAKYRRRCLIAKRPGHLWFLDFTRVGGFFRSVRVGAVVDGFSRKVLAIAVAPTEPSALFAVRLLCQALREFGPPTWAVSDHGKQFTSKEFCRELRRHGIRHRYGAVHRHGSVSIIERWWKSMKSEFAHGLILFRPLPAIHKKLLGYATWFNAHRPHQGLGQRTPDEVHFGRDTRPKSVPLRGELVAELVDDNRALPVLRLRRAA